LDRSPPNSAEANLVIDVDGIDLSKVVYDRRQIDEWNPHRGAIVQLDRVVYMSPGYDLGVGVKDVREDEFWVGGHFPGRPIMPGVLPFSSQAPRA